LKNYHFEVAIIGGGVTGLALAHVLSRFTGIKKVLLIEKNWWVAEVNSHPLNNAQTSHDGSTETNYSLEHALQVKAAATALRRYVDSKGDPLLSQKVKRMVIAINEKEIEKLLKRYREFKVHYPDLWLKSGLELARIEPNLMIGRYLKDPIWAMGSDEGYVVNYQKLAEYFMFDARYNNPEFTYFLSTPLKSICRTGNIYTLETSQGICTADVVVFAAGSYSLFFAQKLGYGLNYGILSVAGSFYSAGHLLDNKIYRMQVEGRPFAEIHGDPDILNMNDTRFGPTTKPLPLMERHHNETFKDYMQLPLASTLRGVASVLKILWKQRLMWYVFKNALFDIPVIGKALFLLEARKIVPTLRYGDLKLRKHAGGVRPQLVDLETGELEIGDASLVGDNIIFNTTPSPGASVCLGNAHRDAIRIVDFLNKMGRNYHFDEEQFQKELGKKS